MPRGSSPKRERQYEHIKDSYEKRGKSEGKAEEIAARTVNKERAQAGETKGSRSSGRGSKSSRPSSSSSRGSSRSSDKPSASRSKSSRPSSSSSRSSGKPSASRGSSSSGRTRQQLYAEAKRKGIEGRSSMNKAQLERALSR
jgi:hypothetical protein